MGAEELLPGADGSTYDRDRAREDFLWPFQEVLTTPLRLMVRTGPDPRPLGRDYSSNQGQVNLAIALGCGVKFMYARAGISWGTPDSLFPGLYANAGLLDLPRTSYHVIYCDQPVLKQADQVWYKQHPAIDKVPRVIDLEVDRGVSHQQVAARVWEMSELVLSRDGMRPMIYSRYLLLNAWLQTWTSAMLNLHYYLLAQYLFDRTVEHPGPPTIPNRVLPERVIFHQTADKKAGCSGEAQSAAVDYNRWCLGDQVQMDAWMLANWGIGEPPPPPPPTGQVLEVVAPAPIFDAPGFNSNWLGILDTGDLLTMQKINIGSVVWVKHDHQGALVWTPTHNQEGARLLGS